MLHKAISRTQGESMKNLIIFLFALIFIPFLSTDAQLKRKNIDIDNVGRDLGKEIEQLVDGLTQRWSLQNDFERNIEEDTLPTQSRRSPEITDSETDENAQTFSGDKIVQESDTINGNIVVKGGSLTVYGVINGDVLVVGGDLRLKRTGKITGNPRVVDGSILKDEGGVIEGYEEKTDTEIPSYRESRKRISQSSRNFDVLWRSEQTNWDNFIFRYNRVESVFLGLGTEKKFYWDGEKRWNAYGSIGWGFKSHTWRSNLGLVRQFALITDEGSGTIEVGAEGYTLTDTKDQWIISQNENTAAALLMHEDFRNYYERKGVSIHTAYYMKRNYLKGELKLAYIADSYDSLTNKVDWALFGGKKKFRANPLIPPGKMRSMILSGGISTITKTSRSQEGWSLFGSAEVAKKSWGSEFDFDQYIIDLRRFQPLGRYENFNVRLRMGSSGGAIPLQKAFELGGLGTMNAFPFQSEIGNRMMLVNMEFILNGSILDDLNFWPTWIFQHVNMIITSDAGFTRSAPQMAAVTEGFGPLKLSDFHHNFGFALGNRIGSFRIGFAWRTDRSAPLQFLLRFNRPF
jgi:hypothetical protein